MKNTLLLLALLVTAAACGKKKEEKAACCKPGQQKNKMFPAAVSDQSVYQLDGDWKNQDDQSLKLASFAGKPVLMTMIYTHCGYACPLMVSDLKKIEALFTDAEREQFHIVLVSFDPDRDSPARLKSYAASQRLGENWTLLQGTHDQAKELSVVLQISFERLSDGSIDHANSKILLNEKGEIVYRLEGLATEPGLVAEQIRTLLKK